MRLLLLLIVITTLVGCRTIQQVVKVETVTVYKAVYTPPKELQDIPIVPRPDIATNYITREHYVKPGEVAKMSIEAQAQLRAYIEKLEENERIFRDILGVPPDRLPESETTTELIPITTNK